MTSEHSSGYEFAEHVPLRPVPPGTSVLVTEPAIAGTHRSVLSLLIGSEFEGTLFLTTGLTGREVLRIFEDCGGRYTKNRMAVIDSSEDGSEAPSLNIRSADGPGDLLGITLEFSSLYEQLNSSNIRRVRTGCYSLTPVVEAVDDFSALYRFLHTVTGRIESAGGLGLFVVDPEQHSEATIRSLEQPFEGRIDIHAVDPDAGEYELEPVGLENQPSGRHRFTIQGDE